MTTKSETPGVEVPETPEERKARLAREKDEKALRQTRDEKHRADAPTLKRLREATRVFFDLHWDAAKMGGEPPEWQGPALVQKGPVPNYDKQGCYAFVSEDGIVTYVGLGVSRGDGIYRARGISARLNTYSRYVDGDYQPVDPHLKAASGRVCTIGFEIKDAYLACALEAYLIRELKPVFNANRPAS